MQREMCCYSSNKTRLIQQQSNNMLKDNCWHSKGQEFYSRISLFNKEMMQLGKIILREPILVFPIAKTQGWGKSTSIHLILLFLLYSNKLSVLYSAALVPGRIFICGFLLFSHKTYSFTKYFNPTLEKLIHQWSNLHQRWRHDFRLK